MNTIDEIQREIIREFALLEDPFDQYAYLLKLSSFLPVMDEETRAACGEVKGCQSHVWLRSSTEDGRFFLEAESDTMLIRGFLYLIRKCVNGQPLADVAHADLYFLHDSGLVENLTADRRKGLGYVKAEILRRAAAYLK